MGYRKFALLCSAAALVAGTAGPASAFDVVDWTWTKDVTEEITKNISIDVSFEPSGMVEAEITQVHIGDSTATALLHDVYNIPEPTREERTFDFTATGSTSGSLDVSGTAEGFVDMDFGKWTSGCGVDGSSVCQGGGHEDDRVGLVGIAGNPAGNSLTENGVSGEYGSEDPLTVDGSTSGSLDVTVSGQIVVPVVVPLDALAELPKIENTATALGNNASIESNRMVEVHTGQFQFGDGSGEQTGGVLAVGGLYGHLEHEGVNTMQSAATALTAAAILGVIEPSSVSADAEMFNVKQAQLKNSATALGNNFSIDLAAATDGDAVLVGDMTQFAYGDVNSNAYLHDVSVRNYNNLGAIDGALFSNVATSIGNNLSIKVSGPDVTVPGQVGGE